MRTLIVFESMYGNTHAIATALAAGMKVSGEVRVVPVAEATPELVAEAELLVVGGPTHAHTLTSARSRGSAVEATAKPSSELTLDPDAHVEGPGLRDWFHTLPQAQGRPAIAFDTRYDGPEILTGHASHGIASRLRKHGYELVVDPQSFLVDKANKLLEGEIDRATHWASRVSDLTVVLTAHTAPVHLNGDQRHYVDGHTQ